LLPLPAAAAHLPPLPPLGAGDTVCSLHVGPQTSSPHTTPQLWHYPSMQPGVASHPSRSLHAEETYNTPLAH
jgi:hypothetical protein